MLLSVMLRCLRRSRQESNIVMTTDNDDNESLTLDEIEDSIFASHEYVPRMCCDNTQELLVANEELLVANEELLVAANEEISILKNEIDQLRRICNTINHHSVGDYNKWFFAREAKGKRLGYCEAIEMLKNYFRERPYDGRGK